MTADPKKLPVPVAIALGVVLIVAMAALQAFGLPTTVVVTVGPAIIMIETVYGIGPAATRTLIKTDINPHVLAGAVVVLTAASGILPVVHLAGVWQAVLGAVIATIAGLIPGGKVGTAATV